MQVETLSRALIDLKLFVGELYSRIIVCFVCVKRAGGCGKTGSLFEGRGGTP